MKKNKLDTGFQIYWEDKGTKELVDTLYRSEYSSRREWLRDAKQTQQGYELAYRHGVISTKISREKIG